MKITLLLGHHSKFGLNCLRHLLDCNIFDIEMIYIADFMRWNIFSNKICRKKVDKSKLLKKHSEARSTLEHLIQGTKIKLVEIHDANADSSIQALSVIENIMIVAYPQIFSENLISQTINPPINVHPSFLPRGRGANPIYWTVANQEPKGGLSFHYITAKIDEGPIISRTPINFDPKTITRQRLQILLDEIIPTALLNFHENLSKNTLAYRAQNEIGSYNYEDLDKDHEVKWQQSSIDHISAQIRAGNAFNRFLFFRVSYDQNVTLSKASAKQSKTKIKSISSNKISYSKDHDLIELTYQLNYAGVRWMKKFGLHQIIKFAFRIYMKIVNE